MKLKPDANGAEPAVRLNHWYGVCPGLFRPLARSGEPRPVLNVSHKLLTKEFADVPLTLRFDAREAPGAGEQTTLLALLAIAQQRIRTSTGVARLTADEADLAGRDLWERLRQSAPDVEGELLRFTTTWREICQAAGGSCGGAQMQVRQQHLIRLCNIQTWEYLGDSRVPHRQSQLLSWVVGDDVRVHLALNHRLVQASLGSPYAQISMGERLSLSSETAQVLHAALSAIVRPGTSTRIHTLTLCRRIWVDWDNTINDATRRRRLHDVNGALLQLDALPAWSVSSCGSGPLHIKRRNKGGIDRVTTRVRQNTRESASEPDQKTGILDQTIEVGSRLLAGGLYVPTA